MSSSTPADMVEVSYEEFFAVMNPLDVHPSLSHSDAYSVWELRDRTVVGRSYPGWKNPGDPKHYFLAKRFGSRSSQ